MAYYPFENNGINAVGNGNNGTFSATGVSFTNGIRGKAVEFNGIEGQFTASTTGFPTGISDRTLTVWAKVYPQVVSPTDTYLAGYGQYGAGTRLFVIFGAQTPSAIQFSQWGNSIWGGQWNYGAWHHYVVTSVGNAVKLYQNGQLIASGDLAINTSAGYPLYLGKAPHPINNFLLHGQIDELRIYNRSFSAADVQELYAQDTVVPPDMALYVAEHSFSDAAKLTNDLGFDRKEYFHGQTNALSVQLGANESKEIVVTFEVAHWDDPNAIVYAKAITNTPSVGVTNLFVEWPINTNQAPPGYYAFRATLREPRATAPFDALAWQLPQHRIHIVHGNPVILVHGIGDSATGCWGDMEMLLKETNHFACVSFDYHGMTDTIAEPATIENIAAAFAGKKWEIRDEDGYDIDYSDIWTNSICYTTQYFGMPKVDVVAHSMGGLVTRAYMAGMAHDYTNDLPYGGEIGKIVTLGTPLYGRNWISGGGYWFPGHKVSKIQLYEMTLGSRFLWRLHNSPQSYYAKHLAIAGVKFTDFGLSHDYFDDFVVSVPSACGVTMVGEAREIFGYKHATSVPDDAKPLVSVQAGSAQNHEGYKLICQYLNDQPLTEGTSWADLAFYTAPVVVVTTNWFGQPVGAKVSASWFWVVKDFETIDTGFGSHAHPNIAAGSRTFTITPKEGGYQTSPHGFAEFSATLTGGRLYQKAILMEPSTVAGNQITESFAQHWFNTSAGTLNAEADPDNDGLSNLMEQQMGLNPTNHESAVRIENDQASLQSDGTNALLTLSVDIAPGFYYQLEAQDSLSTTTQWQRAGAEILGTGIRLNFIGTNAPGTNRFYRIQVH